MKISIWNLKKTFWKISFEKISFEIFKKHFEKCQTVSKRRQFKPADTSEKLRSVKVKCWNFVLWFQIDHRIHTLDNSSSRSVGWRILRLCSTLHWGRRRLLPVFESPPRLACDEIFFFLLSNFTKYSLLIQWRQKIYPVVKWNSEFVNIMRI